MTDNRRFLIAGIAIALVIGASAAYLAASDPDGLESTALYLQGGKTLTGSTPQDAELQEEGPGTFEYHSPFQDYQIPGLDKPGEVMAIALGTLAVVGLGIGLSRALARPK